MRRLAIVLSVVGLALAPSCAGSEQRVDSAADGSTDTTNAPLTPTADADGADDQVESADDLAETVVIPGPEGAESSAMASDSATDGPERGDRGGAETATPRVVIATPTATPRPTLTSTPTPVPTRPSISGATPTSTPPPTANPAPPTVTATAVTAAPTIVPATPTATVTLVPSTLTASTGPTYFETLPPGSALPSDAECAALVRANPARETHPDNAASNARAGGPQVLIDGAEGFRGDSLASRISGNFTGTTDEILRWVSCKWGIDEDITRARAWTESSWRVSTQGDQTDIVAACDYLGLATPCSQSYGLLQVKGTIHEGTYPRSFQSTAWGVDYAMAWQRACFEGAFTWLDDQGYTAGNLTGCVGAWYSGEWFDAGANRYLDDFAANLRNRPWD